LKKPFLKKFMFATVFSVSIWEILVSYHFSYFLLISSIHNAHTFISKWQDMLMKDPSEFDKNFVILEFNWIMNYLGIDLSSMDIVITLKLLNLSFFTIFLCHIHSPLYD
jgi:hypothetical protein